MMTRLWETRVDVDFNEMSLEEAFAFIEERSGLDMRVQWRDLDEAGLDPDTPVTLKLRDVALAEVLDAVLESVGEPGEWSLGYEPALVLLVSTGDTLPERPGPIETTRYNDATYKACELGRLHPTRDSSTPSGVYIPKDVEDCFVELKRMLHPDLIQKMNTEPESKMIRYHFGLGMWIRNQWGLWGDSRLEQYFTNMGVSHPDDMSGIILDSFWRHLNGVPLRVDEQIEHYRENWRKLEQDQQGADEAKR